MEKLLYCIKDTLNFKEACRYTGLSDSQLSCPDEATEVELKGMGV